MFSKKCKRCGRKIEKEYDFCPYCGNDFRMEKRFQEDRDFGFLGKEDSLFPEFPSMNLGVGMPFGKLFDSLIKQLDVQMRELDKEIGKEDIKKIRKIPGMQTSGFNISIASSNEKQPEIRISGFGPEFEKIKGELKTPEKEIKIKNIISEEKAKQIAKLPRKEAETKVRRLSNKIIYEISLPEVDDIKDVILNKLENSIEIKAFSKDKVYFKLLPVNLPIVDYKLQDEKLILELKTK